MRTRKLHSPTIAHTSFFRSVRFRLTLWYLALLAVILAAFGLSVYYAQQHTLTTQYDDFLRTRIQRIALTYNATTQQLDVTQVPAKPTIGKATSISANAQVLLVTEVAVLVSPQGGVLQSLGGLSDTDTGMMISLTLKASADFARGGTVVLSDEPVRVGSGGKLSDYGLIVMPIYQQQQVVAYLIFGMPSTIGQQLSTLALTLLLAGIAVLLLAAWGGFWLAGRTMRPIEAITATAQQINASDLSRRLDLTRRDELGELAGTFDAMLDRLENAFLRQRQFTADASHELRTPLTIVELEASRLLEQPGLPAAQREALLAIQREREYMARVVDDLLFLARADAGHVLALHETVPLDEVILEVVERFASLACQRHLRIQVAELPDLAVRGDQLYLARMLGNLIENALKYSGPNGTVVDIALAATERDGNPWACITIRDDGAGIASEHLSHLFERFYRASSPRTHTDAETDTRTGSGLGLAIAQQIATLHSGALTIASTPDVGTTCTVLLPLYDAGG